MGILSLLFSFNGRINRAQYWLGGIGAGVGIAVIACVLMVIGGPVGTGLSKEQQLAHFAGTFVFTLIPAVLVLSWIGYALAWKRFHDRGKSGVWVFLPMPFSFMMMSSVFGAVATGADPVAVLNSAQPWSTILWLIQLWFLVELGFMPSKAGPNKYGDPPGGSLKPATPGAPSAPAKSMDTIPGMKSALGSAESAMDRAIAEQARAAKAAASVAAGPRPAAAMTGNGLRPATPGSFGRKATH